MLSERLLTAGKASDDAADAVFALFQEIANGGPMAAMSSVDKVFAAIESARLARRHYADLFEGELSALEDRVTAMELARG